MDISFAGAGFMGCYYFGVADCLKKHIAPEHLNRLAGTSLGSIIATYIAADVSLAEAAREFIDLIDSVRTRNWTLWHRKKLISDGLRAQLNRVLPDDVHIRVNGRLFVSMTRVKGMKNVIINQFESKEDLIDAIVCSCFIPAWSGSVAPTFRTVKHVDGLFSNNLPVFNERTIRVCCFSGASDIAPDTNTRRLQASLQGLPFNVSFANLKRTMNAFVPPTPSYVIKLLEQGYEDTKNFIINNGLIQCDQCFKSRQQTDQDNNVISAKKATEQQGEIELGKLAFRRESEISDGPPRNKFIDIAADEPTGNAKSASLYPELDCSKCARLIQAARASSIDAEIMRQAEIFLDASNHKNDIEYSSSNEQNVQGELIK